MNFVEAITKTMNDLQANPVWQREALIGQGVDPLKANVIALDAAHAKESDQIIDAIRARIDAGEEITPGEIMAIGARSPELARVIVAMLGGGETPSNVREYQFFNQLSPEEQNRYLTMKRSSQIMNLGGTQAIYDPLSQGKGSEFAVTPKPEQMPEFQGEQARAKKAAEIGATAEGDIAKKGRQAEGMLDLVAMAEEVLPKATSGTLEKIGTSVAGAAGVSTERSRADKQLKVISAGLVANVPRMEGAQSNYDVQLYREAAGDIANPDLPDKDRMAALQTVKALQQKYAGASFLGFE